MSPARALVASFRTRQKRTYSLLVGRSISSRATTGFEVPIDTDGTITGHIEFLQTRNGAIHIVDYKPGAKSEKPIPQLMTYALALTRRTGLRLYDFVCSCFDEHNYYQFYPLHVVHKRPHADSASRSLR